MRELPPRRGHDDGRSRSQAPDGKPIRLSPVEYHPSMFAVRSSGCERAATSSFDRDSQEFGQCRSNVERNHKARSPPVTSARPSHHRRQKSRPGEREILAGRISRIFDVSGDVPTSGTAVVWNSSRLSLQALPPGDCMSKWPNVRARF